VERIVNVGLGGAKRIDTLQQILAGISLKGEGIDSVPRGTFIEPPSQATVNQDKC
jgi:hypothetical protein